MRPIESHPDKYPTANHPPRSIIQFPRCKVPPLRTTNQANKKAGAVVGINSFVSNGVSRLAAQIEPWTGFAFGSAH
jgi:hypothetical protein